MGDFNYSGIDWVQLSSSDTGGQKFVNLVMDCFLDQHVCNPNRDNNILDLVLTNEVQITDKVKILPPIDNCDHNVLLCGIDCAADKALSNKAKLCFNRANYDDMRQFVGSRLCCMNFASMSASALWCQINNLMQEAIRLFVPVSTKQNARGKPLWMTGKVLRSVKKKHRLSLKWKQHDDDSELLKYRRQANKASKVVKLAKKEF